MNARLCRVHRPNIWDYNWIRRVEWVFHSQVMIGFFSVLSCLVLDSTFVIHLICVVVFYYLNLMVIHANDIRPIKSEYEIKANVPPVKCHSTKMRTLIIYTQTQTWKADLLNLIHRKIFFFKWNKQHVYLYIYSRLNKSKNWWIASQCQQQVVCYKINFVIVFCFHCFAFWITHLVFVVKKKTTRIQQSQVYLLRSNELIRKKLFN